MDKQAILATSANGKRRRLLILCTFSTTAKPAKPLIQKPARNGIIKYSVKNAFIC